MPIKRAGPWGNITNSFQDVPGNTGADGLTLYPVNCAKTDWVSGQAWGAYYEVVSGAACNGPATITATSAFFGNITLDKQAGDGCTYYWVSPSGPFSGGEATIYYSEGFWIYEQSLSYAPFETSGGGSDADDPTGTYYGSFSSYTVTTP